MSALGNVHTLNLLRCTGIADVSALGNVHTLKRDSTDVTFIRGLSKIVELSANDCQVLEEIKVPDTMQYMDLVGCEKLQSLTIDDISV